MSTPLLPRRTLRALALAVGLAVTGMSMTGCSQLIDTFNSLPGQQKNPVSLPSSAATAQPMPSESMAFNSQFSYDGSVALDTEVADDLEVRLEVWAADPKRTREWTPQNAKTFGFAINVFDHRVDEKAVLTEKRRVYISSVSITSQTAQTSGQVQSPFQFSADPRTLVPSDTLRSDRGLLLNSYQGGLLVPETVINQLPADTYGITLEFAMQVWVEGTANTDSSFTQQTVYQYLPVAVFPAGAGG